MKYEVYTSFGEGAQRIDVIDLGRIEYLKALEIQKDILAKRHAGEIPDTMLFCEHDPVITLGRGAQRGEAPFLDPNGIPVVNIERGGLATYHGPGQLVAYPIFQLARGSKSWARAGVVNLIRSMEAWLISVLAAEGLESRAICEKTGVWITSKSEAFLKQEGLDGVPGPSERKIASIGIAVRRWVSFHGLALNFNTGLEPWKSLRPCGFQANVMTDLLRETGKHHDYAATRELVIDHFWSHFEGARMAPLSEEGESCGTRVLPSEVTGSKQNDLFESPKPIF